MQYGYILHAALLIIAGFFISRLISSSVDKALRKRLTAHQTMLIRRILFYAIFILFLVSAAQQLGFRINTLLGATGILTVAIGIAAQTSMSNVISGIFIIGEKPFEVGNTIKINNMQGEVMSIDFLSVKIRTSDNTMIRIPNEVLIKSSIANISFFPTRRIDLMVSIAYKENVAAVKKILLDIAKNNPLCLAEPQPAVNIDTFADSSVNLQFSTWVRRENYTEVKNSLQEAIQTEFTQHNIEIPYLTQSHYTGKKVI